MKKTGDPDQRVIMSYKDAEEYLKEMAQQHSSSVNEVRMMTTSMEKVSKNNKCSVFVFEFIIERMLIFKHSFYRSSIVFKPKNKVENLAATVSTK